MYESRLQPLLTRAQFVRRVLGHIGVAVATAALALYIGMAGYHVLAGLNWVDSLLNASMILGGKRGISKSNIAKLAQFFRIDAARVMDAAKDADVVLIALAIRAKSGAGTISIPPLARRLLDQLAGTRSRVIAVSFGSPYVLRDVPSLPTYLAAYGIQPVLQVAAVRAVFGETAITGKLPVSIPGMYARGHGVERR